MKLQEAFLEATRRRGVTYIELANAIGVTPSAISRYISGKTKSISYTIAMRFHEATGIKIDKEYWSTRRH